MSTVDTSSWNPDADLNVEIEGIPLNADAGIAQTWQVIRILMAAFKGDTSAIQALMVPFSGATASADGASGFVPKPLTGDQDKFLKGDGTWDDVPVPNLGTASRAVQTDADGILAVSSVTATELGYLSGVTSAVQTQLDAKAADSDVVHKTGDETIGGVKTLSSELVRNGTLARSGTSSGTVSIYNGSRAADGGGIWLYGKDHSNAGKVKLQASDGTNYRALDCNSDGTLTWMGQTIQVESDERVKTPLFSVPDDVLNAWEDVRWGQFQFLDAVKRKGDSARLHLGLIAQRVKAAFEAHGLDACRYGVLCYEKEDDLWMIRYEEALAMEAACQRRRADRLDARIKALEEAMR